MTYVFIFFLVIFLLWAFLVYSRKSLWDVVHRNLLDLQDAYEGRVMRRSFLARPVFNGKINGREITINFSSEKLDGKRITYIDITFNIHASFSCTIAASAWLKKQQDGKAEDFTFIQNNQGREFLIRPASDNKVQDFIQTEQFHDIINKFDGLAYLFVNRHGLICEFETEDLARKTEFEQLNSKLVYLENLEKVLQ